MPPCTGVVQSQTGQEEAGQIGETDWTVIHWTGGGAVTVTDTKMFAKLTSIMHNTSDPCATLWRAAPSAQK